MPIVLDTNHDDGAKIKVIGVGGSGGNAINNMIRKGLQGVEFIAANTDKQALEHNLANVKIQIGKNITRGLGAGADPEVGKASIDESEDDIRESLKGSDMVFITCGMGGGTGTGAAPKIAKIAQELNTLVVAIVTKPFKFEGKKRNAIAEKWLDELREFVDALIVIPNQKLLEVIDKNTTFQEAFLQVDEVLYDATRGISEIISNHGYMNVDFADVVTIMKGMGDAIMGIGHASGDNRAIEAAENALNSPILDGVSIEGAKGLLVNITGGCDMTMMEISEAVTYIEDMAGGEANLIQGVVQNSDEQDEIMITVVATGFDMKEEKKQVEAEKEEFQIEAKPFPQKSKTNERTDDYLKSPRGPNQLQNFSTPAFRRREETSNKFVNSNGNVQQTQKQLINSGEIQNQPTFIRKIMS